MKTKQDWMMLGVLLATTVLLYLAVAIPVAMIYGLIELIF